MEPAKAEHPSGNTAEKLLRVVQELVGEVHPHRPSSELITLDSAFEKDLGLDSLARVELISRVEKQFELALPERTFAEAETPRDLLRALLGAGGLAPLCLLRTRARYSWVKPGRRQPRRRPWSRCSTGTLPIILTVP